MKASSPNPLSRVAHAILTARTGEEEEACNRQTATITQDKPDSARMVLALLSDPKKLLFGLIAIGIIVAVIAYAVSKTPAVSGLLAGTALAGMAASAFGGGGGGLLGGLVGMFSRDKKDNDKDVKGAADIGRC
ncbi:hypothetical protein E2C01_081422 [Portunus trituberculatus]|uniref:Uncharacterized protein n=1 Tax=Portunus trituberculatus TaxID=210409 RepID=A0A5B7J138_PORTR|nr:hypothetical protein [Portunus trituberculatus]